MKSLRSPSLPLRMESALLIAALLAWVISLALPGFIVGPKAEIWYGGPILGYGLFFGWMCSGWAVYANVFFIAAVVRLAFGAVPRIAALLMVVLAAMLPLFKGPIRDEGSGAILPIQSWGVGAGIWLLSIAFLAGAIIFRSLRSLERQQHAL